ncbi:MAG: two-component regulator propeller domain-containing protein [Paludibacter sp.]
MKKYLIAFALCLAASVQAEIYNFARLDNTQGLSNNEVGCIFKDSRGFMWFGTNYGLNRYDGYNIKVYKSIKNDTTSLIINSIPEIKEDYSGNLWIKSNPNYVVYDVRTEKFIRNLTPVLAPMGVTFSPTLVEIDKQKNYYFYQTNVGVFKYDVAKKKLLEFRQTDRINSISKGNIVSIKPMNGYFWVLFQSGKLERFNEKTNSIDFRNNYVAERSAGSFISKRLFIDADGRPWVYPGIADKGVLWYNFNTSEWVFFGNDKKDFSNPSDRQISSDFVRDIAQEKNGRIWISTDHGGVNIFDNRPEYHNCSPPRPA